MRSRDDEPLLIVERTQEIRIDTGHESLSRIEDAIEESDAPGEIDYLQAVKRVVQYGQAEWFDAGTATDTEPADPARIDEEELSVELAELEADMDRYDQNESKSDDLSDLSDGDE